MHKNLLLLIALGSLFASAYAQEPVDLPQPGHAKPLRFEHLNRAEGLSAVTASSMLQDRRGFLWIGTGGGGLNRYDGYTMKVYDSEPFDSTSLPDNHIQALLESRDGRLWVASRYGLNLLNPETETFTRYSFDELVQAQLESDETGTRFSWWDTEALAETADGAIWVGAEQGLARFDPATGDIERIVLPYNSKIVSRSALFVDANDKLWISTNTALMRLDPVDLSVEVKLPAQGPEGVFVTAIHADVSDPAVLWLAGWGITRYDTRTDEYDTFLPDPTRRAIDLSGPADNWIRQVVQDPSDPAILWAGTFSGLRRFDTRQQQFVDRYISHASDPHSLSQNSVGSLYVDRSGLIWMGGGVNGMSYFDPSDRQFTHYRQVEEEPSSLFSPSIRGFAEDASGALWIAQFTSLSRLDRQTGTYTHWPVDYNDPQALHGQLNRLHIDQEGIPWILSQIVASTGGLYRMDPARGIFHQYPIFLDSDAQTVSLYTDRNGVLWVGATDDLYRYDRDTDTFTPLGLAGPLVSSVLYEDQTGRFWLGSNGQSLGLIDRTTREITWYPHDPQNPNTPSHTHITFLHEREREPGILWMSTYGGGLNRFDTNAGTFTHYTEKEGLSDNVVYGILEDDEGLLWLSTNHGISRFNPETEEFRNYGPERGIQSLEFNGGAFYRSPTTGEMFFGGNEGFNVFHPSDIIDDTTPPPVVFTELRLFNQPVEPGADAPIKKAIDLAEEIRLQPEQDVFTLEFAALNFLNPEGNQYRYFLEGYDRDWVEAGTKRSATYTNLPPGNYIFRVHAANADGVWNEDGASVRVVILPPWWRTTWAYVLYGILLLASVFAVDRIQRRRLLRQERERTMQREVEQKREIEQAHTQLQETHQHLKATQAQLIQSEKMASLGSLTAGIAHEIKNPLNFVNNFAEVNEELAQELREALAKGENIEDLIADLEQNASVIAKHGKRADSIVKSMMEHARGGEGQRQPTQVNTFVEEYFNLAYHGMRANVPDFNATLDRDYDEAVGNVEMVPQEIGRVLINLLNNAFYAVHEQAQVINGDYEPTVKVSTKQVDGAVEIRVLDNGPGIPADLREKIFEPFYTTKPTGQGNTGLGLSLSYDIVTQGHGGTLTAESIEGEGASFVIALPVNSLS